MSDLTATDYLLDFVFLPCPHCRIDQNEMTGAINMRPATSERGGTLPTIRFGMRCKNGHSWTFRITNDPGSYITALNCLTEVMK